MPATTTVTAIRTTIRSIFGTMHVGRATTALARTANYFDIIYEICFHCLEDMRLWIWGR